jgi:hypothetical protein
MSGRLPCPSHDGECDKEQPGHDQEGGRELAVIEPAASGLADASVGGAGEFSHDGGRNLPVRYALWRAETVDTLPVFRP